MCDVDMTDSAAGANVCEVCGAAKRSDLGGYPSGGLLACEKCFDEVVVEAQKRAKLRAAEEEETSTTAADSAQAFGDFLKSTASVLFHANPCLKPKIIVDKAVAVWEAVTANPGYAEVVDEMTKRTTEGSEMGKYLERTLPGVFAENRNLKPKIIVDKAVAMWENTRVPAGENTDGD